MTVPKGATFQKPKTWRRLAGSLIMTLRFGKRHEIGDVYHLTLGSKTSPKLAVYELWEDTSGAWTLGQQTYGDTAPFFAVREARLIAAQLTAAREKSGFAPPTASQIAEVKTHTGAPPSRAPKKKKKTKATKAELRTLLKLWRAADHPTDPIALVKYKKSAPAGHQQRLADKGLWHSPSTSQGAVTDAGVKALVAAGLWSPPNGSPAAASPKKTAKKKPARKKVGQAPRIAGYTRTVLSIARNASPGSAPFNVINERAAVKRLAKAGMMKITKVGKFAGKEELMAKLTAKGLAALEEAETPKAKRPAKARKGGAKRAAGPSRHPTPTARYEVQRWYRDEWRGVPGAAHGTRAAAERNLARYAKLQPKWRLRVAKLGQATPTIAPPPPPPPPPKGKGQLSLWQGDPRQLTMRWSPPEEKS